jgi:hypothetical protein
MVNTQDEGKRGILKANKITRAQNLHSSENLGKNVANHINAQGFKEAVKAPLRTKNLSTKPDYIEKDGTF